MTNPIQWMRQAIALAEKARFHAPPNPWVGCVIVKEGKIVGEGYSQPPGQAHAEIGALQQAGEKARGAILYVTLEPCDHTGRTPPCTEALIRYGISEVYVGVQDPDLRVRGKGIARLREAGIRVFEGICAEEICNQLCPYLHQRTTGLPYTIVKTAMSIDGRIAAADLSSQWITSEEARQDAHVQRSYSQAIVIGSGTALRDSPQLTVRLSENCYSYPPLRVLLDGRGRVPAKGPLFDPQLAPTLVVTTSQAPQERQEEWRLAGAEVECVSSSLEGVDLQETWQLLGKRSLLQILVEGGAQLHTSLLETSLVNRMLIYIGPLLLGASGYPFYQKNIPTLQLAQRFSLQEIQKLGDCVRLNYSESR